MWQYFANEQGACKLRGTPTTLLRILHNDLKLVGRAPLSCRDFGEIESDAHDKDHWKSKILQPILARVLANAAEQLHRQYHIGKRRRQEYEVRTRTLQESLPKRRNRNETMLGGKPIHKQRRRSSVRKRPRCDNSDSDEDPLPLKFSLHPHPYATRQKGPLQSVISPIAVSVNNAAHSVDTSTERRKKERETSSSDDEQSRKRCGRSGGVERDVRRSSDSNALHRLRVGRDH